MLAEDGLEVSGQLSAYFVASFSWEKVSESGDGTLCVAGVYCGEDHMSGFGGGEGHLCGFLIADLADHDDVGVLAEAILEPGGEAGHVDADFTLGDERVVAEGVDVLDGLFNGYDSAAALTEHVFEDDGQGGTFTRSGYAGDEYEAVAISEYLVKDGEGDSRPFERGNGCGDSTNTCSEGAV